MCQFDKSQVWSFTTTKYSPQPHVSVVNRQLKQLYCFLILVWVLKNGKSQWICCEKHWQSPQRPIEANERAIQSFIYSPKLRRRSCYWVHQRMFYRRICVVEARISVLFGADAGQTGDTSVEERAGRSKAGSHSTPWSRLVYLYNSQVYDKLRDKEYVRERMHDLSCFIKILYSI